MSAIRQMRYCTGNVTIRFGNSPVGNVLVEETLLMPALDQNKIFVVPFAGSISNGPFSGWSGSSYFSRSSLITNGVKLTFYSNAVTGNPGYQTHTFTYQLYIIEFY